MKGSSLMSPFRKASSLGKRKSIRLISVDDIPRWLSIVHFTCICLLHRMHCNHYVSIKKKNTLGTAPTLHSDTIKRIRQLTEERNPSRTVGQTFGLFAPPWGSYCLPSERESIFRNWLLFFTFNIYIQCPFKSLTMLL